MIGVSLIVSSLVEPVLPVLHRRLLQKIRNSLADFFLFAAMSAMPAVAVEFQQPRFEKPGKLD
jgi:hypothetical protein